ncbi:MAG: tripartite tricarboxylate transporter substrate binding protein [Burkholderiales bacterium]
MMKSWIALPALALFFWQLPAECQTYPSKPIRFIVPFAPGGGNDIIARLMGQRLTEIWGQAIIVDNRPGAGGNVAGETTARAAPDGYTAFQFNIANTIAFSLHKDLRYDPVKDFSPVTQIASSPFILLVHPGVRAKTVPELVTLARQSPGQLTYASSGSGGASHLAVELFKVMTKTDIVHVPYGGAGPALNDVLGGRVQLLMAVPLTAIPHMKSGKGRGIAVTGSKRLVLTPELPTIAESGVPGYESGTWYGIVLPARTPPAIASTFNSTVVRVLREPDIEQKLSANGLHVVASTQAEFGAFIRAETAKWAQVVKVSKAIVD